MLKGQFHHGNLFLLIGLILFLAIGTSAQAQLRIAPIKSIGDSITCHVGGKSYELKPDQSLLVSESFAGKTGETQSIFNKVTPYTKLRNNLYTVPVENDINVEICPGDVDYIAYNAAWLITLYKEANNQWALYAVIAHEIGHYVLGHDRTNVGSEPGIELEADEYAGEILAKMGASLSDAQAAYHSNIMASQEDHKHPPIAERLAAVERGWKKVRTDNVSEECDCIKKGPIELENSVYRGGLKNEFQFRFKMAAVQFNNDNCLRETASKITDQSGSHRWDSKMYYWKGDEDRLLLAWKNLTNRDLGWIVVEEYKGQWYYKSNGDNGNWTKLDRGEKTKVLWNSSGQKIEIFLKAPNLINGWTAEEIQYGFGYSN